MSSEPEQHETTTGRQPIPPGKRRRLQQSFEHGNRNMVKGEHDYAHDMFTQCVVGDPGNLIYAQTMLGNLFKKYNNNKKGSKLSGLKTAGSKSTLKKAAGKEDWPTLFKAGCDVLKLNPWDTTALCAMAAACEKLEADECQLFYLRAALSADSKDVEVNRLSAMALARQGEFDQAIACWHRVELAKPEDQEARKAIADLTVERTIHHGHYEEKASGEEQVQEDISQRSAAEASAGPAVSPRKKLEKAIAKDPAEVSNYLKLAELHLENERMDEAEATLQKGLDASGGTDLAVRQKLEDLHLNRKHQQVLVAEARAKKEGTEEAIALAKKVKTEQNHLEMEIYAARCERNPGNPTLQFELGTRLKKAGKYNEAIKSFQVARTDVKRKALIHLELGECFHHIKQFKLAMSNYKAAVEDAGDSPSDTKKLALYRAGVLSMGLKDMESADKYLTELADIDFAYKDVSDRLDKLASMRNDE